MKYPWKAPAAEKACQPRPLHEFTFGCTSTLDGAMSEPASHVKPGAAERLLYIRCTKSSRDGPSVRYENSKVDVMTTPLPANCVRRLPMTLECVSSLYPIELPIVRPCETAAL